MERQVIPVPGELWQHIAVGYCEWENGDWPDDQDIEDARPAAKHIEGYVARWVVDYLAEDVWSTLHEAMPEGISPALVKRALLDAVPHA